MSVVNNVVKAIASMKAFACVVNIVVTYALYFKALLRFIICNDYLGKMVTDINNILKVVIKGDFYSMADKEKVATSSLELSREFLNAISKDEELCAIAEDLKISYVIDTMNKLLSDEAICKDYVKTIKYSHSMVDLWLWSVASTKAIVTNKTYEDFVIEIAQGVEKLAASVENA